MTKKYSKAQQYIDDLHKIKEEISGMDIECDDYFNHVTQACFDSRIVGFINFLHLFSEIIVFMENTENDKLFFQFKKTAFSSESAINFCFNGFLNYIRLYTNKFSESLDVKLLKKIIELECIINGIIDYWEVLGVDFSSNEETDVEEDYGEDDDNCDTQDNEKESTAVVEEKDNLFQSVIDSLKR